MRPYAKRKNEIKDGDVDTHRSYGSRILMR